MSEITAKRWLSPEEITFEEQGLPVRQAYVWFVTADQKVVVVSKDGNEWQLPGGKPNKGEDPQRAVTRELREETGVELEDVNGLVLFGANHIVVIEPDRSLGMDNAWGEALEPSLIEEEGQGGYLQLRFYYRSPDNSEDLRLTVAHEDSTMQPDGDRIAYIRAVTADELEELIPWLVGTDEYDTVKTLATLETHE